MRSIRHVLVAVTAALALAPALAACDGSGAGPAQPPHEEAAPPAAASDLERIQPSTDYPLRTCIVSGEELGTMGSAVAIRYEGREVQFCCPACIKRFGKDPAKYMAQLDAASR